MSRTAADQLWGLDHMFSEETLREAAAASLANAKSLRDEARLLAEHGFGARAAALAIIGIEEFAKAIVYTVAALLPDQRRLLRGGLNYHEVKHQIANCAEVAQIESSDYFAVLQQESGSALSAEERLTIIFGGLTDVGLPGLLGSPAEAKKFYKELQGSVTEILVEPYLKNAAMYVDLGPTGEVLTPDRAAEFAESKILGLEWFLTEFRGLPEIFTDDAAWRRFFESVRRPSKS